MAISSDKEADDCTDHELLIRIDTKMDQVTRDIAQLYTRSGETKERANHNSHRIDSNRDDIEWNRRWFGMGIVLGLLGIVVVATMRLIMGL